ncbi:MAG: tRNA (N6-isopentenyl adenosine(37)-C2)-methylthiotransferase MiaB [Gammaproteobacteria bacterium]|jgi:tRNA-2-methylthio-N6-dimethylallyladenosine synthase|nr:tRNA (N6-isopentenyl adenosine(37)-C2)-methylthiotransferase MiaB [Gammaproteobacteria bacterium]
MTIKTKTAPTRKLFIKTYGCQMNEYDSSRISDVLADSHDLEITTNPEEADVLLLNTCSIRERAQEKVFSQLGRWKNWKKDKPDLVIGVGGCVASQEGAEIQKRAPYVDMVFGPQTIHRLPEMLSGVSETHKKVVDISFPEIEKFDCMPAPKADGPTAFVSIMEGCSKYCSFCVVPYTRGEEVSRPFDDVLAEVAGLAEQGVREVNLLGQNVNAYRGVMQGEEGESLTADLALLIHYVAAIDGIDRIRFTTSHPMEFNDDLVEVYAQVPELVSFLHLPVQSGSDKVLSAMKRGHTAEHYKDIIRRLKIARPGIFISSDFIVGFPDETDEDFADTIKLIEEVGFDYSYSFIYSARPGTPAASLLDNTTDLIKKHRLAILQDLIASNTTKISEQMVGTIQTVLVNNVSRKSDAQMSGRTENNRVVNFAGTKELIGQFVDVEITEARTNSLQGELVGLSQVVVAGIKQPDYENRKPA